MYIVSESAVKKVATPKMIFDAVKIAFISVAQNRSNLFPVVIASGLERGDSFSIKSGNLKEPSLCGVKLGSYWPNNHTRHGVPNHSTVTVLLDTETGIAKAVVNAGYLNGLRTSAANAVASSVLARKDSKVLSVLGAGHQAYFEIQALCSLFAFDTIHIWNRTEAKALELAQTIEKDFGVKTISTNIETAVGFADILITVTNSTKALFDASLVKPGTHISAMGADQKGKQELPVDLLKTALCFADFPKQSLIIGEFESLSKADFNAKITAIGEVLVDPAKGRTSNDEITVFDSSGIAIQDLCAAYCVLESTIKAGLAQKVQF